MPCAYAKSYTICPSVHDLDHFNLSLFENCSFAKLLFDHPSLGRLVKDCHLSQHALEQSNLLSAFDVDCELVDDALTWHAPFALLKQEICDAFDQSCSSWITESRDCDIGLIVLFRSVLCHTGE